MNKLEGCQNGITEIKVQGEIEIESKLLLGDACPYCTTNQHDNGDEQKVCDICS